MQKRSKRLCLVLAVLLSVSMALVALAPAVEAASYKKGSSGAMVTQIQTKLKSWGYYTGTVDGVYGSGTERAVRAFQQKNGLTADGVAGRQTQELLFSGDAVPASATPRPSPTPTPTRYTLMVDVTNQIVRAYTYDENGQYTVLVREMICSTGTEKNPTPLGTTIMPSKRARWGYFPTWDSHAQYLTRIDSANIMLAQTPVFMGVPNVGKTDSFDGYSCVVPDAGSIAELLNTYFRNYTGPVSAEELNLVTNDWPHGTASTSANVQFVGQLDKESDDAILNGDTDVAGATTTDGQVAGQ